MSVSVGIQRKGNGTRATVSLTDNGKILAVDSIDLASKTARGKLIEGLDPVDLDGSSREEIEQALMAAAVGPAADLSPYDCSRNRTELPGSRLVRPERFILNKVSGVTVPRRYVEAGEPGSEWLLCLEWSDGTRQAIPLPASMEVDGEQVFLHPQPPPPSLSMDPGWSVEARAAWIDCQAGPAPEAICKMLLTGFSDYLDLPPESGGGTLAMLSMWTVLSYIYPVFDAVPYLAVGGPAGSGKSRVFELLEAVVFRPLATSNLSNPALFRSLHGNGGVLLLDEAERLRDARSPEVTELMSSLLAGYKRGGCATRCEAQGDGKFDITQFQVFGPKALASINEIPPALASRCIPVQMFRSPPGSEKPKRRVTQDRARWQEIRDSLYSLGLEYGSEWLALPGRYDVVPPMSGRHLELWQPLLAIAAWFEAKGVNGLLGLLQNYAIQSIESNHEASTPPDDELLLRTLVEKMVEGKYPTASELLDAVTHKEPSLFRNWSARAVSSRMKRYGLLTSKSNGVKIYKPAPTDLARIQAAYGIDLGHESAISQ